MDVDVTAVPLREADMEPFEIMTSESQERMLAIVEPGSLDEVLAICERWEVRATVIGRVTGSGRLRILDGFDGEALADLPASSLHESAPRYERPLQAAPARPDLPGDLGDGSDAGADLLAMLFDPAWVSSQYDHQLFLNTVEGPGGDAVVLRLKHPVTGADTGRGLAITTDGNHRWCAVDPRLGTAQVVAESTLNLACVGARPLALVNCLNFGNPEHPEVMWQLSEAIDGMGEACRALGVPVVGGNVSLYNESRGKDIDPTPVVGMLGVIDRLDRRPPGTGLADGGRLVLLGDDPSLSLGGSRWARDVHGATGGALPPLDLRRHTAVCGVVRDAVAAGLLQGVHDVSEGGLGIALAEMAVRSATGFRVSGIDGPAALFSEAPSRAVACVAPDRLGELEQRAGAAGVPLTVLGDAGGDRLVVDDLLDVGLHDAVRAWRDALPAALAAGATH